MSEGFDTYEMNLGRKRGAETSTNALVELDTAEEMREAFLSDSPYSGMTFSPFVAHTLISDGALRVVASNLHRFPESEHKAIIESLSETEDGRKALGLE